MVKILTKEGMLFAVVAAISFCSPLPAYSQSKTVPAASPAIIPGLPNSSREIFPKLPVSSLCSKDKVTGMWKLLMVYEFPPGKDMNEYYFKPMQYFIFEPDTRYAEYKSILQAISLREIRSIALIDAAPRQQFTVNSSGMLFFYKNSIAVDSLACFMVAGNSPPFRAGQMLLMPPEKAAAGTRLLKVYEKVYKEYDTPYYPPRQTNSGQTKN